MTRMMDSGSMANATDRTHLDHRLTDHGEEPCTIQTAQSRTKANLY